MHIKKRENESASSLLFRFNKRIKQSGLLKEARKRRFAARPVTKQSRLASALHREEKKKEHQRNRKMGIK
jgi:ribosomal protein S21